MTTPSANKSKTLTTLGLILCLSTVPFVAGLTGCAGSRYTRSTGEQVDDHDTSTRVSIALADDPQHKYFGGVNVVTYKDVVQLSGFVNTADLKNRAGDIARDAAGGRSVRNNITLKE